MGGFFSGLTSGLAGLASGGTLGGVLGAAGGLLSAAGKGSNPQQALPTGGYAAAPKEIQDILNSIYLPAVMKQFNEPYKNYPMMRYEAPSNPNFVNPAFQQFQQYSDASGGFFSPYRKPDGTTQHLDANGNLVDNPKADAATSNPQQTAFQNQMLGRQLAQQMYGSGGADPHYNKNMHGLATHGSQAQYGSLADLASQYNASPDGRGGWIDANGAPINDPEFNGRLTDLIYGLNRSPRAASMMSPPTNDVAGVRNYNPMLA